MAQDNYQKMFALIDEVFALRDDVDQLQVTDEQREKLMALHPATLSELANDAGPLIWCLLIPTTTAIMQQFLAAQISEKQVLELTPIGANYDALYLCSVTTLPEARNQGNTFSLCVKAITEIQQTHPISTLFVWPFSEEGKALSQKLAGYFALPLQLRPH